MKIFKLLKYSLISCLLLCLFSCDTYNKLEEFKYNQNIFLSGVVSSIPRLEDDKYKFILHTDKYGDVLLTANKSSKHFLIPANKLELEAKIYKPHEYDNVAAFNYSEYLDNNDIVAVGSVLDNSSISYQGTASLYLPERIRYYLYNHLQKELQCYRLKPYILALLIGDKNFDESQQNLLINSGTSHLMVISGLHIGLLALIAFVSFRLLWSLSPKLCRKVPAQYVGVIASLVSAFVYSLLAGFSLPTQRAVIMLSVVAILWLIGKRVSIIGSLGFAFILILLLDFEAIYSVSLWLSFSAVSLLVVIAMILQQYKSKLVSTLLAQTYLAIFLVPISVYYFGSFSLVSILANIVAIPMVSFVIVPLSLFCLLVSFIGISLWSVPIFFLKPLMGYLSFLTSYSGLVEYWSYFSLTSLIIVVLGLVLVLFPFAKSIRTLGLALCLVFFQSSENIAAKYDYFNIHVFDTQDQMILVQDEGKTLLYTSANNLSNDYVLSNSLKSYLKISGVKQLDYLIVTGAGQNLNLSYLTDIVPVKNIITNLEAKQNVQKCSYSNNFNLNDETSVKLLSAGKGCFVSLNYDDKEFLLAGDTSNENQQEIYTLYNRMLKPNIIFAPVVLDDKYFSLGAEYFVYSSDDLLGKSVTKRIKTKIFDTYANGAIDVVLDKEKDLKISSQLKDY